MHRVKYPYIKHRAHLHFIFAFAIPIFHTKIFHKAHLTSQKFLILLFTSIKSETTNNGFVLRLYPSWYSWYRPIWTMQLISPEESCDLTTFTIPKALGLDQRCPVRAWYSSFPFTICFGYFSLEEEHVRCPMFETVSPSNSLFFPAFCDLHDKFFGSWSHCSCHIIILTITIPVSPCIFPSLAQIVLGTLRLYPCRNRSSGKTSKFCTHINSLLYNSVSLGQF